MPIRPFTGNTFVAFIDISGFKVMMKNNDQAVRALTRFYQAGYDALEENGTVQGFSSQIAASYFQTGAIFKTSWKHF